MLATSRSRRFSSASYLTSFGSRPVSLRIFSSTFLRLSLAFSSCSCKVLTATAIFSLQQASRLLYRPRRTVSRRETREDWQQGPANDCRRCFSASTTQHPEGGEAAGPRPRANEKSSRRLPPSPIRSWWLGPASSAEPGRVWESLGPRGRRLGGLLLWRGAPSFPARLTCDMTCSLCIVLTI